MSLHAEDPVLQIRQYTCFCTASVDERIPPFLRNGSKGWVTAEYGICRSTHSGSVAKLQGRREDTLEIQRLIERSLRAVTDLTALGERQIKIDCDDSG